METQSIARQRNVAFTERDFLYNYAFWMTGNEGEASTLVREIYSEMFGGSGRNQARHNTDAQLFRIMRSLIKERVPLEDDDNKHRSMLAELGTQDRPEFASSANTVFPGDIVAHVIRTLPEQDSTVIILSDMLEFTHDRIAELIQCPVQAVPSRLQTARKVLRVGLSRYAEMQSAPAVSKYLHTKSS